MGIMGSIGTLLNLALTAYTWMILIRVALSWVNPDPYNPIVQFLVRFTEPLLEPLRRLLPPIAGLDLSPIVALLGLSVLQHLAASLARGGGGAFAALLLEVGLILHLLLTFYLLVLLARGGLHVHSWLTFRRASPFRINLNNAIVRFVFQSTEPIIRPLRPWIPTASGLDISPLVVALVLFVLISLLQELTSPMVP